MRHCLIFSVVLLTLACNPKTEESSFFDQCPPSDLFRNGSIPFSDSLGEFSFRLPDSSWHITRYVTADENGISAGDMSTGYIRVFSVNRLHYDYNWNWADEQREIEDAFNVLETRSINLNGQQVHSNLVLFEEDDPSMISLFVSLIDSTHQRFYTLHLMTEYAEDYPDRLCAMRPLLERFHLVD